MNQKIITIAEIVFALIFVVLLAVFMATINSKGNSANNQLVDTLEATDTSNVKSYTNGMVAKGSRVTMAIDQINSLAGDVNTFKIVVKNKSGDTSTYTEDNTYNVTNSKADDYINQKADYHTYQIINGNGIITGLLFVQDGITDADDPTNWEDITRPDA